MERAERRHEAQGASTAGVDPAARQSGGSDGGPADRLSKVPRWASTWSAPEEAGTDPQPLDDRTRTWFEERMGVGLGDVRIHEDADTGQNQALSLGRAIYFAPDEFDPDSSRGRQLLAHELGHVTAPPDTPEGAVDAVADSALRGRARPPNVPVGGGPERPVSQTHPRDRSTPDAGQRALARIHSLLSTGVFDWFVTDAEAIEVLRVLQRLPPDDLLHTVMAMRLSGNWATFRRELPATSRTELYALDERLDRHTGHLTVGDHVQIEARVPHAASVDAEGEVEVAADGARLPLLRDPVDLRGMLPQQAADAVANAYVRGLIYVDVQVRLVVTQRSILYAPQSGPTPGRVWYTSAPLAVGAAERARRDTRERFFGYVSVVHADSAVESMALTRYLEFVEDNANSPRLASLTPPELWGQMLHQAHQPPARTPTETRQSDWLQFIQRRNAEVAATADQRERERMSAALRMLLAWYTAHGASADVAAKYAEFYVEATRQAIQQQLQVTRLARERAAEATADNASVDHVKDFIDLALRLRAMGVQQPYVIPVPSEGIDILVTDDPGRRLVLNNLANDLISYALTHVHDPGFRQRTPAEIVGDLYRSGYREQLAWAATVPLTHEVFDRNEILAGRAAASFGATVGTGLLVIGLVGAAVGLGVPVAAAMAVLALAAAGSAVMSYLDRRQEIEEQHAYVSVPETMVHSIGDAVGLSQLIESVTGERLGTGRQLGSARRSDEAGVGAGSVALLLTGSRAYRQGQVVGEALRPRALPAGPEGALRVPPGDPPTYHPPSTAPGPLETAAREALPVEQRVGFDDWMAEVRRNGGDPETVLGRMTEAQRTRVAAAQAARRLTQINEATRAEWARMRARDNALRPQLPRQEVRGGVTMRWTNRQPVTELPFAQEIAAQTGERVELFGDTATGRDYPGIDGVIGDPPRPLQLKTADPNANANFARWQAEEAFIKAQREGYSHVEVRIRMPGSTRAQVRAAWDGPPPDPSMVSGRTVFDGTRTVARYVVHCSDGVLVLDPPAGPALPALHLPLQTDAGDHPPPPR
jgi:hypothetical protein